MNEGYWIFFWIVEKFFVENNWIEWMFLVWYFVLLHISSRHQLFSFHLLMPNDKIDFMTWAILDWKHWIYHWFLSRVYAKYFIQIFCIFWGSRILSLGRFHNVIFIKNNYKWPALSVGRSVGWSVGQSHLTFFLWFYFFDLTAPTQMIWWPQIWPLPTRTRLQ